MQGCTTGVITQLKQQVPNVESLDSSNTNNLANAMMHAVSTSDPDTKMALVDLYQDIGGAKGKGTTKMKDC
jgi:2-oxo-4-hydroxy-4-carboxy--5-ureidoimidazoline (OHCU) decarboxylase